MKFELIRKDIEEAIKKAKKDKKSYTFDLTLNGLIVAEFLIFPNGKIIKLK